MINARFWNLIALFADTCLGGNSPKALIIQRFTIIQQTLDNLLSATTLPYADILKSHAG
jgi:hypothetical protein